MKLRDEMLAETETVADDVEAGVEDAEKTIAEQIAGATSHAHLQDLAAKLGVEVPADAKAPWTFGEGEDAKVATTVAEKKDALAGAVEAQPAPEPQA